MNYEVRFAAGIETESPKCEGKCVDGLVVNSPAAAQQNLLLRTFYLTQIDKQTTTKYYNHV
jgi:hypothetical protein